jgi:hypothetical protein
MRHFLHFSFVFITVMFSVAAIPLRTQAQADFVCVGTIHNDAAWVITCSQASGNGGHWYQFVNDGVNMDLNGWYKTVPALTCSSVLPSPPMRRLQTLTIERMASALRDAPMDICLLVSPPDLPGSGHHLSPSGISSGTLLLFPWGNQAVEQRGVVTTQLLGGEPCLFKINHLGMQDAYDGDVLDGNISSWLPEYGEYIIPGRFLFNELLLC